MTFNSFFSGVDCFDLAFFRAGWKPLASCEKDETLASSSLRWKTAGYVSRGGCWTRATSESPRDAVECSLSEVLEKGSIPEKYFLSPKAASGILARAKRRGRELPPAVQRALEALASERKTPT